MKEIDGMPPFFTKCGNLFFSEIDSFRVSLEKQGSRKMMELHLHFTDGSERNMLIDHKTAKYFLNQLNFALKTYKELTR